MKKTILAFSGGLDTCFLIPYLKEKGYEVITVTVDTGGLTSKQVGEISEKSKKLGAIKHFVVDAKEELYEKFATYIIKSNYQKGGVYPACVGPERVVTAMKLAEIAEKEKIEEIVHGSTGAGNDQVRFDVALKALIPQVKILAPIRDEEIERSFEVRFLNKLNFEVPINNQDYSYNLGILGTTISGKETNTPDQFLPNEVFPNVKKQGNCKNETLEIKLEFRKGLPVKIQYQTKSGLEIIQILNHLLPEYGFGKDHHIGTTIIGTKGKIGFEAPGMKFLIKAHSELEKIILTSKQLFWKNHLGQLYGDLIHEGLYFDPFIKDLEALLDSANQFVEGEVIFEIATGSLTMKSLQSPYSLLNPKAFGTYGEKNGQWSGLDAKGFCQLYGMESINAFHLQNQES